MPDYKYSFRTVGVVNNPCGSIIPQNVGSGNEEDVLTQPGKEMAVGFNRSCVSTIAPEGHGLWAHPWRKMVTWSCKKSTKSRQETLLRSKAETLLCALPPPSLSLQLYRCGGKSIHQWVQQCRAAQGLLCQPSEPVLLQTCSLQSHPMKYDGLGEIYFASLDWLISASSKCDSFNHHQLLLSLCSDSCCATLFITETFEIYCI